MLKFEKALYYTCLIAIGLIPPASAETVEPSNEVFEALLPRVAQRILPIFDHEDLDKNGQISLGEYVKSSSPAEDDTELKEEWRLLFNVHLEQNFETEDLNSDGVITIDEYARKSLSTSLNAFFALDADSDNSISFSEFIDEQSGAAIHYEGGVAGTSFRYGVTPEELGHPFSKTHDGQSNLSRYMAYVGHAFARTDKDENFVISLEEFLLLND